MLYPPAADDRFDIGEGVTHPDDRIMTTGHVDVGAYISDERYEMERDLFGKLWLVAGRVEQLPAKGDWFVRDVECRSVSAIVTRDRSGDIRAFHNICSHRGMKLMWEKSGHGGKFVCPYHAWMYDNTGALTNVPDPDCFPKLDRAESGLKPIHCEVWEGFIFINLAEQPAQTLLEYLGPLAERLAGAPFGHFTRSCTLSQEVVGNWKFGVEAASEGYHVQALHTRTVGSMLATKANPHVHFLRFEPFGPHRNASIPCNPDYRLPESRLVQRFAQQNAYQMMAEGGAQGDVEGTFTSHPAMNPLGAREFANEQFNLFPNFSIHITPNGYWTTSYWPITKERSRWRSTFYYRKPQTMAEEFAIQAATALNRDIFAEDNSCFQKQQAAMESGGKPFIQLAESEIMLRHQLAVIEAIAKHREADPELAIAAE